MNDVDVTTDKTRLRIFSARCGADGLERLFLPVVSASYWGNGDS